MIGPNSAAAVNARFKKQYGGSPVNRTRGLADLARRDRQMAAARRTQGFGAAGIGAINSAKKAVPSGMFGARGNVMLQDVNRRMGINANMAAANKRGINRPAVRPAVRPATSKAPINATADVVKESKKGMGFFKNPKQAAMIGLGLGIATSVAMNRRGEGVSPGRQSNARY
jgi:hypothetical protein